MVIALWLVAAGIVAFAVTYLATPWAMRLAERLGAIDVPGGRHVHERPTPRMGGVAIFAGIAISCGALCLLGAAGVLPGEMAFPESLNPVLVGLGVVVIFATGFVDDAKYLTPKAKLVGQVIAATLAFAGGVHFTDIRTYSGATFIEFGLLSYFISVFYLVAFANIINLIDGLDGLAAGVTAIAATAILVLCVRLSNWPTAVIAVALVCSALAFLRYNFYPASVFMGDSGSLTLGFVLGMASMLGTMRVSTVTALAVPVIIAAIPVLDTFAAIVRRLRRHAPISSPDKGHMHHGLLQLGLGQMRVVLLMYAICVVFAVSGVVISGSGLTVRVALVAVDLAIAAVLVWKLRLFGPILARYYPGGIPSHLHHVRRRARTAAAEGGRLRVLVVCEHFAPSVDACSKRMRVLAEALEAKGHEVHVLASETSLAEAPEGYEAPANVHFYPAYEMKKKDVVSRLRNNWSEKAGSERLARGLGAFDVVICTSPPLMLALSGMKIAKETGACFVFDVRDIWPDVAFEMGSFGPGSVYAKVFSYIAERAYAEASLIVTVSRGKVEHLRAVLADRNAAKVRLVPNGLDLEFLAQPEDEALVARYGLDDDPPVVYVGNLGLAQGLSTLLEIAARHPERRFLLFGSGAEQALLEERVASEGLSNVRLCGRVSTRGAHTLLSHALMAYVPLKNSKMTDSVPTKLFEALGTGCPVLLAAAGDSRDILEESGLGMAAAPEDPEALQGAFDAMCAREWTAEERERAVALIRNSYSRQAASASYEALLWDELAFACDAEGAVAPAGQGVAVA